MSEFQLSAELIGHEEDVRGLCVCDFGLVTVSRDKTAKVWTAGSEGRFELNTTLIGHTDYVNTAACLAHGMLDNTPQGSLVTGSRDKAVIVWDVAAAAPLHVLQGHEYQVTDVIAGAGGSVVSCSLDKTIRTWADGECTGVLRGHEGPVQCLALLPGGELLSGSNDCTVRVWADGKCVKTLQAHSDTVRGMAVVPGIGVATCSHDQTAKVWTAGGDLVSELVGHTALVYAVAASDDASLIATASEDNTCRLWQLDGVCLQTIEHPGCVWDAAFLPNGDLVTACADSVARVWTRDDSRAADESVSKALAATIASRKEAAASSSAGGGGALPEGLTMEDPSALLVPGTRSGQTKIIREGNGAVAYGWSAERNEWEKIGDVMGGAAEGDTMAPGSKMFNGQVYDYVFDVDFADGMPHKRLPINRGDNPYTAAEQFLLRENLPMTYREQVVQFILANTGGAVQDATVNVDPYTGASAYVPRGAPAHAAAPLSGAALDPLSGAGAYVPGSAGSAQRPSGAPNGGAAMPVTGGGVDPFTGSTARSGAAAGHVPARSLMVYDNVPKLVGVAAKIRELSGALGADERTAGLAVPASEEAAIDALLARASSAVGATAAASEAELALLTRLLAWPAPQLFPALDIARMLALSAPAAAQLGAVAGSWGNGGLGTALAAAAAPPALPANQQTALRLLCNCLRHAPLSAWTLSVRGDALDAFAPAAASPSKAVRQGLATLLLNYSVALAGTGGDDAAEGRMQVLSALAECLPAAGAADDADAVYRCAVGVGTLVSDIEGGELKEVARDLGVGDALRGAAAQPACAGRAREACLEAAAML